MEDLLTRDKFRESVFDRDNYLCVICKSPGKDAHHIIERRLFDDGGYYLDNGATLCEDCHLKAEMTIISPQELRDIIGITTVRLPEHLYDDLEYDKWGNVVLSNGTRLKGELFNDQSVQKILSAGGVLSLFSDAIKYPRTYHVPWSQDNRKDDKYLSSMQHFEGKRVIITEKMDGENTTMYHDRIHARSINSDSHPSRGWVKGLHAKIGWEIPRGWRVCGENLYARHTVKYTQLDSYFMVFSVWDETNFSLSWDETIEWSTLLGLQTVPILYDGIYDENKIKSLGEFDGKTKEGWVIRLAESFHYSAFRKSVAKYVSPNFVLPHGHWSRGVWEKNELK